MRPTKPRAASSALLVIDMQEYFRGIAEPMLAELGETIAELRAHGVPVVYTQHGHDDPAQDGGMLYEWWDDHIVVGSSGWALMPEVAPAAGEPIIPKKRYSAFHDTGLDEHLKQLGVTDLAISGVMTNLCCETTARDGFVRDYRIFFLTDGTATAGPSFHQATLRNLGFGFATLLTCRELRASLQRGASPR